ncbi:hypothetical protein ABGB18_26835 [Nonomuraea sp. B12E4]|uniref:pectate lyase family protein n=1 Tax=Nonomuraea sp. B12E4 TaxID=3153564 RepID=UPI00325CDA88
MGSTTRPGNNVMIRNIRFTNAEDDSISVTNKAHHVWIDHNGLSTGYDGLLDIKRESDYVTVSWNRSTTTASRRCSATRRRTGRASANCG